MYYFSVPPIQRRALAARLDAVRGTPVIIVEGARAVGKTTMARRQLQGYDYASLADPRTLAVANDDPARWLRTLRMPAVIDEAQLLPELPLAVKEHVDSVGAGARLVLTGSASLGRAGLGGADPLTRRAARFTMHPLTRWEIAGRLGSLVDLLFDAEPVPGRTDQVSDAALLGDLRTGGFPAYVYPSAPLTTSQLRDRLSADLTALLSDDIAPDLEFNVTKARTALDALLRTPGGILNAARLGREIEIDKRTVERYVDVFSRLFLIRWLPNLATEPRRQTFARSKVHPVDSSFAVGALERCGVDLLASREHLGMLLESHVVTELLAASEWATLRTRPFYWRQASSTSPEVDLVLLDEADRCVAVEVKAAASVNQHDLSGVRALSRSREVHRAFVIYRGDTVRQLAENVWALPYSVLSDPSAFTTPSPAAGPRAPLQEVIVTTPTPDADASVFLSYVRRDDDAQRGRITQFARDLTETYELLYGHPVTLFVDREDIARGENWQQRLGEELGAATFLLAVVTPRYLTSEACRREVVDFGAAAEGTRDPGLLLPLVWVDISGTDVVAENDPVRRLLYAGQQLDVTPVRRLERGSPAYEELVEQVAARLKATVDARARRSAGADAARPATEVVEPEDGPGASDLVADLDDAMQQLSADGEEFKAAVGAVSVRFTQLPSDVPPQRVAAALAGVAADLRPSLAELDAATERLSTRWAEVDVAVRGIVAAAAAMPPEVRTQLAETLDGTARTLTIPGDEEFEHVARSMGAMSRYLRPASRSLLASLRVVRGIAESVRARQAQLG